MKYLYIVLGGSLGALFRYWVSGWSYDYFGKLAYSFPVGTLNVNFIGSFLIGVLWEIFENFNLAPGIRTFVFIGFLGAFTTFSTFMLETFNLYREGEIKMAILNLLLTNVLGVVSIVLGYLSAQYFLMIVRGGH